MDPLRRNRCEKRLHASACLECAQSAKVTIAPRVPPFSLTIRSGEEDEELRELSRGRTPTEEVCQTPGVLREFRPPGYPLRTLPSL